MNGVVNWNKLNGFQIELLWKALTSDFNMFTLDQALQTKLHRKPLGNYSSPLHNFDIQVFQLIRATQMQGWTRELVEGVLLANPDSPGLRHFHETVGLTASASMRAPQGWKLEDLLRPNVDFLQPDGWLTKLAALRRQVCRIEHPSRPADKPGFGTGWLVGADLLLTNFHVIAKFRAPGGLKAADITCRFDVPEPPAAGIGRTCGLAADWLIASSPPGAAEREEGDAPPTSEELDFAVVRLAEPVAEDKVEPGTARGRVDIAPGGVPPAAGDVLLIVQHPEGLPQRFAFGNATALAVEGRRLLHDANTLPGSSGSPVVDVKLDVVALHHAGGKANQAVPIGLVVDRLAAMHVSFN